MVYSSSQIGWLHTVPPKFLPEFKHSTINFKVSSLWCPLFYNRQKWERSLKFLSVSNKEESRFRKLAHKLTDLKDLGFLISLISWKCDVGMHCLDYIRFISSSYVFWMWRTSKKVEVFWIILEYSWVRDPLERFQLCLDFPRIRKALYFIHKEDFTWEISRPISSFQEIHRLVCAVLWCTNTCGCGVLVLWFVVY